MFPSVRQFLDNKRFGRTLHNFFDAIYCINLDSRPDRWSYICGHFKKFGLMNKVVRYSAIDIRHDSTLQAYERLQKEKYSSLAMCGCMLSHRKIIETAKDSGFRNVLVFEDDVKFLEQNLTFIGNSLRELANREWQVFYLGATYIAPFERIHQNLILISNGAYATHAIAYNRSVFDKILKVLPTGPRDYLESDKFQVNAMDVWLQSELFDHNQFYGAFPLMAVQGLHESDISAEQLNVEKIQLGLFKKNLVDLTNNAEGSGNHPRNKEAVCREEH